MNLAGYDNYDSKKRTTEAESRQVNDESLDEDFCFRRPVTLLDFWAERKNLSSPLCPDRKKIYGGSNKSVGLCSLSHQMAPQISSQKSSSNRSLSSLYDI